MRIKQSICCPMIRPAEMPLETLFRAAGEIGYAAVEVWQRDEEFGRFVELAREQGLAVATMIGHSSLAEGLNDPANHDRIEAELRGSVDIAERSGIPGIICFSGNRREGVGEEEAADITAEGLRRVASYAEEKGVNLNLELLNSKRDHKGYQCDHTSWGAGVCRKVGSPRVKLLFDIYHMQIMEGDIITTIRDNVDVIGHFHTAGNPGRRDLDDSQELNYRGICRAIAATGYDLYVGHEFRPKGDTVEAMRTAFSMCDVE